MAKINPVKLKQDAEKLEIAGRPDQAVILYRQILEDNPRDWNVINKIGDIYAKMNRAKEASEEYAKVADFYAKDGFLLKAIAIWKKINKLDASALEPYQNLAELYGKQGLLMEAKSQYQFVVDELIKRGRVREAGNVLKKMAEVDPGDLKIRSKLADLYTREGDPEKAVEEHVAIAEELNKKGHLAEALQVLEKGLKIVPKSPRLLMELARVHLIQKNFDRAGHYLEEAVQQDPNDPRILIRLGEAYLGGKKIEEAEAIFKRLLELNPNDEEARVHMGRLCLLQEHFDRAYDVFLPVVERLTGRREGEKAAALLQMVVQKNPSHIKSLLKLVDVYRAFHKDMAVSATYSQLAEAYVNQGRFDEAASVLELLLAQEPYNQQLQTKLEFVKGRMSESGPAPPAAPSGEFMDEEFDLGRPEAAVGSALPPPRAPVAPHRLPSIEITGPLSDDDQEFVEEHLAEGRVFRKYGLVDKAADQFEAVVARFPDNIDARQELREIFKERGSGAKAAEQCLALVEIFRLRGDEKAASAQEEEAQRLQPKVAAMAAPPAVAAPKPAVERGRAPSADALAPAEEEEEIALEAEEVALEASVLDPFSLDEEAPFEGELVQQFLEDEPAVGPPEETPLAPETALWAPEGEDESPLSLALEQEVAFEEASRAASPGATAGPPETAEREVPMALRRVLDEVDQYVALGFVEDAKEALQEIVARYPGHPAISSKIAELGIEVEPVPVPERGGAPAEYSPIEAAPAFEATLGADFEHPLEGLSTPEPEGVAATGESIEGPGVPEELGIELEASTLEIELEAPVEEETPSGDVGPEIPVFDLEPEAPSALVELSAREAESGTEGALVEEEIELPFVEEELALPVSEAPTGELEIALPSEELEEEPEEEAPLAEEGLSFEAATTGPESLLAESLPSGEELLEEQSSLLDLEALAETADVDLATQLGELFGTQTAVQEPPPEAPGTELGELGLADIFKEFKKGVDKQLSHEDYDTRYNLGIAYKEMGLLDEAIAEFQLAAKDQARLLECASMLGICFMEKGMPKLAIKWFEKGLKAPGRSEEEYSGLRYDLATAYEAAGDVQTAFNLYSELYGQDANFRDVAAKVRELRGAQAPG